MKQRLTSCCLLAALALAQAGAGWAAPGQAAAPSAALAVAASAPAGTLNAPVGTVSAPPVATGAPASVPSGASAAASASRPDAMAGMYGTPAKEGSGVGHLLQVIGALLFVVMLMLGLAWFLKNHGPKSLMGRVPVKVVGGVNLGGRERVLVIEVADQWLVIGATPGQITTLATLPRQAAAEDEPVPGKQFSIWLKQIMEKRNG